jgi:hypothetical protein
VACRICPLPVCVYVRNCGRLQSNLPPTRRKPQKGTMEKITIYKAADGTSFESPAACKGYEQLLRGIESIERNLRAVPPREGLGFENGEGYVQQPVEQYPHIQSAFLLLVHSYMGDWVREFVDSAKTLKIGEAGNHVLGRILCEGGNRALNRFWTRLGRIDSQGREWGQLYYARYPKEKFLNHELYAQLRK